MVIELSVAHEYASELVDAFASYFLKGGDFVEHL